MTIIKSIYWKMRIVHLSLRWIFINNLGDKVYYNGKDYILTQGVRHPIWTLVRGEHGHPDYERIEVHKNQFKKDFSLKSCWFSFMSGYRFYMAAWYSIWMHEGIKDWMRGCNIWGKQHDN